MKAIATHFLLSATVLLAVPTIRLTTDCGVIEAELHADQAPTTVANFLKYVEAGRYTGGGFHRTVKLHPDNQPNNTVRIEVLQDDYSSPELTPR